MSQQIISGALKTLKSNSFETNSSYVRPLTSSTQCLAQLAVVTVTVTVTIMVTVHFIVVTVRSPYLVRSWFLFSMEVFAKTVVRLLPCCDLRLRTRLHLDVPY